MIHPRPTLPTLLCALLATLATSPAGRAEAPKPPAAESTGNVISPPPAAIPALPAGPAAPEQKVEKPSGPKADSPASSPAGQVIASAPAGKEPAVPAAPSPVAHPKAAPAAAPAAPTVAGPTAAQVEIASLQKVGLSLAERGDWDAAKIAFRQIIDSPAAGPTEVSRALLGLARAHRRAGELTKATAIYERFLKDYPNDGQVPDALLELGRTLRSLGASQLALGRFYSVINSTLKLPGEEGFAHYQMLAKTAQFEIAETHFQQGEFADANKYYTRLRLLDLAPADRARAHFKSAYALYLGGNLAEAVVTLHTYLEQWPRDENVPEARYLLSRSLRALGRKDEALQATLDLLRSQQSGGDAKAWTYWQRRTGNQLANDFFQNGDTTSALAIYQGLAALSPDPAWRLPVEYQIGLCFERLRSTADAVTAYQSVIDGARPSPAAALPASPGDAAAPAAPATSVEFTELARMAAWRIKQLNWDDHTGRLLSSIFSSGVIPEAKTPLASPPVVDTVPDNPPPSAASPAHAPSGNPAAASPSL
jgi:TolA-binding protein